MTLLSNLPPEIIDYIAFLCGPAVIARTDPRGDLKNLALVSPVFNYAERPAPSFSECFFSSSSFSNLWFPSRWEILLWIKQGPLAIAKSSRCATLFV
jgi:hypothetical protein